MIAKVQKPDGTYEDREMGDPVCGSSFCDQCDECIACNRCDQDGCGWSRWVIYPWNPLNPYHEATEEER
jgi:hypothetical protein